MKTGEGGVESPRVTTGTVGPGVPDYLAGRWSRPLLRLAELLVERPAKPPRLLGRQRFEAAQQVVEIGWCPTSTERPAD
jgi:hypothetical protein